MGTLYNISDFLRRDERKRKSMDKKRFLSSQEVAHLLGISVRTVCAWAEQYTDSGGKEGLPSYRFGRRALSFDRQEIEAWIQERKNGISNSGTEG
jgi:excisionase family DNA binding protein